jgi:hypothetical protein
MIRIVKFWSAPPINGNERGILLEEIHAQKQECIIYNEEGLS